MATLPTPVPSGTLLHLREAMLEDMENDLIAKANAAYKTAQIAAAVKGIFSLDDMEDMSVADLNNRIGVGVGYAGAEPYSKDRPGTSPDVARIDHVNYKFLILIAIPVDNGKSERYSALQLLTLLRRGIAGKTIAGDRASRTWLFDGEAPRIAESTSEMMYYAQVWRVALPNLATTS